jgi:hypothetical protein
MMSDQIDGIMDERTCFKCYSVYNSTNLQLARVIYLSLEARKRCTAINLERVARHMRTACTRQEQTQSTEIARLADSAGWLTRLESFLVLLQSKVRHPRGEDAGANDVAHDVLWCEF